MCLKKEIMMSNQGDCTQARRPGISRIDRNGRMLSTGDGATWQLHAHSGAQNDRQGMCYHKAYLQNVNQLRFHAVTTAL